MNVISAYVGVQRCQYAKALHLEGPACRVLKFVVLALPETVNMLTVHDHYVSVGL